MRCEIAAIRDGGAASFHGAQERFLATVSASVPCKVASTRVRLAPGHHLSTALTPDLLPLELGVKWKFRCRLGKPNSRRFFHVLIPALFMVAAERLGSFSLPGCFIDHSHHVDGSLWHSSSIARCTADSIAVGASGRTRGRPRVHRPRSRTSGFLCQ